VLGDKTAVAERRRWAAAEPYADAALRRSQEMPAAPPLPAGRPLVANFAELAPDGERFPVAAWRAAMDAVLQRAARRCSATAGDQRPARTARAAGRTRMREIDPGLTADDVLVTAGAQQALDLVLRTFCTAGDTVVVTSPSYHQMHGLLRAHGLQVVQVPFAPTASTSTRSHARCSGAACGSLPDADVPQPDRAHARSGAAAGAAGSGRAHRGADRRGRVPEFAAHPRRTAADAAFARSARPDGDRATMSKELFPALRIGWIAGSKDLLRPMAAVKRFMDLETSPLLQAALVEFVQRGHLDRYLDALRGELRVRHAALQRAAGAPARRLHGHRSRRRLRRLARTAAARPRRSPRRARRSNAACASCPAASSTCTASRRAACACR
jgi:GntR family transcriptional regulator/MocR family aminotransferase